MKDRIVELRRVKASELRPNPRNWRRHPESQRAVLQGMLEDVGYADALLVRPTPDGFEIVDGHLRAELSPDFEVPVLVLDVSEEEADRLLATLDPIAAMAEVDPAALRDLLATVQTESPAVRDLLADLARSARNTEWSSRADTAPVFTEDPVTAPGDLWILGQHRLLCGDATDAADMKRLMDGRTASLFHTDPPYLVDYIGCERPSRGKDWSAVYREIDIDDAEAFLRSVFTNALDVLDPDAAWYVWHAHKRAALIEQVWTELGVLNHQQIIWVKPCLLHGFAFYPWQHEPCLMGWRQGHKPAHDGQNTSALTSVWHIDWEGKARVVGNEHPTQKPVELFAIPMRKHTQPGDICFEPFCGSGSQLIAAEQLGRVCYAMEIEPRFCDAAVARWEALTEAKAIRVAASKEA